MRVAGNETTETHRQSRISKSGLVVGGLAGLWFLIGPLTGHMGPPWPCLIAGIGLLACIAMAWRRPGQYRAWGLLVVLISGMMMLIGTGAIPPAILGIIGGVFLIVWSDEGTGAAA